LDESVMTSTKNWSDRLDNVVVPVKCFALNLKISPPYMLFCLVSMA
jgi:hypothetical protein